MDIRLTQFDGPFDLLLQLIDSKELSITEVSLSEVTEQFLTYLDAIEDDRPSEVADFLTVAARLLLQKSYLLLPQFQITEEDDGPSLKDQLALYEQYREASIDIHELWNEYQRSIFRVEPSRKSKVFVWPKNVSLEVLHKSMVQLVHQLAPPKPLPQTSIDRTVSLKRTIHEMRIQLKKQKNSFFWEHVDRKNKTSIIVGFLALLELVKQADIYSHQEEPFTDIALETIKK